MTSTVTPITENIEYFEGEVPSSVSENSPTETQAKGARIPKRILHFSDGTLEEFSTDEEDDDIEPSCKKRTTSEISAINPATLAWIPWMFYKTSLAGNKALAVCDFLGEYLANFFGIITPKYDYEIEHYKRMIEEEKERKAQDVELGGWEQTKPVIVTEQFKNIEREGRHNIAKRVETRTAKLRCIVARLMSLFKHNLIQDSAIQLDCV